MRRTAPQADDEPFDEWKVQPDLWTGVLEPDGRSFRSAHVSLAMFEGFADDLVETGSAR